MRRERALPFASSDLSGMAGAGGPGDPVRRPEGRAGHGGGQGHGSTHRPGQLQGERRRRGRPSGGILRAGAGHDGDEVRGNAEVGSHLGDGGNRIPGLHLDHGVGRLGGEGGPADEHAPGHDADRVDVRARIGRLPEGLLGRQVLRRAHHEPRVAPLAVRAGGHPEVEDLHDRAGRASSVEEDVLGLEIPVDDPLAVRRLQAVAHLDQDGDDLRGWERPGPPQPLEEPLALEQLHGDEARAVRAAPVVEDAHHVLVVDHPGDGSLAEEAADRLGGAGQVGLQQLERHLAPVAGVLGDVHGGHAARGEVAGEPVASRHHGPQQGLGLEGSQPAEAHFHS